jgi:DNA-nicking Smr family endonuclease
MDFNDILRQWEDSKKKEAKKKAAPPGPGKKANAPSADEKAARAAGVPAATGAPTNSAGRAPAATPESAKRRVDDYLSHWITMHGVPDKDEREAQAGGDKQARIDEAERLRRMRPQAVLDLHGKTAAEADRLIAEFLFSSSRSGLEKVLIVHGKGIHSTGGPVMAEVARRALETNSLAGSFGPADRDQGGRGATWVRIRKRDYFSR